MKFDNLKFDEEKTYNPSTNKKSNFDIEFNNIEKTYRYNNVSVILMKKNTKGNFRTLSTLVNDGKYPCSWAIRVHYNKNSWFISVAPHDTINKDVYDLNLYEYFYEYSKSLKNIKYLGYKTYISFENIKNKNLVEKIVSTITDKLSDIKLEILHPVLYLDFKKEECSKEFRIKSTYLDDDEIISESMYEKYLNIIKNILNESLPEERIKIEKIGNRLIKEKTLPNESKDFLDTLSEKYISQEKRISISLRNLLENKFDEE